MQSNDQAADGPPADLRVLEKGQLLAEPICSQVLADFSAGIITSFEPFSGSHC